MQIQGIRAQALERKKDVVGAIRCMEDAVQALGVEKEDRKVDKTVEIDSNLTLAQLYGRMGNRTKAIDLYHSP